MTGPYMVTVRIEADPEGGFVVLCYVDGKVVDRLPGFDNRALAKRAADDLVDMLQQTGGKLPPEGKQ